MNYTRGDNAHCRSFFMAIRLGGEVISCHALYQITYSFDFDFDTHDIKPHNPKSKR